MYIFQLYQFICQSEGEQIFKSNCAILVILLGGGKPIGPDTKEWLNSDRFTSTDDPIGTLVKYVQNPADFGVLQMQHCALNSDEIKQVLAYVEDYVPEVKEVVDLVVDETEVEVFSTDIYLILLLQF